MTKELLQQALDEAKADAIYVFTYAEGISAASKDAIEYMHSWLTVYFEKQALAQQEQPASVDAYVGAREDAAIWKKRALEAEELNRKFIAEVNGPTYLGEPAQQEQPAQEPAETVTLVGIKDGIETVLGTVSTPPEMKAREIIRNYGWNPDDQDDFGEGETAMCIINDLLAWMRRQGAPKIELAAPTQPALSDEQILDIWAKTYVQRGTSGLEFAREVIKAHCNGGLK